MNIHVHELALSRQARIHMLACMARNMGLALILFSIFRGSPNIEMDEHTFMVNRERAVDYLNSLDKVSDAVSLSLVCVCVHTCPLYLGSLKILINYLQV